MDHTNAMGQMFYEMISSGQLCPPEERIKFKAPLPKEHFHPFEENGMDFMQAMELTHKALLKWLPIGKETSRFGFEYIKISRMIENAVTTLGRGLMTMRVHGIDLAEAPISIGELLKIASFHFQKSYQGAMAAVNSDNQDAFMRLFTNQLRWLNMLQRLERTRDKLNQPYVPAAAGTVKKETPAGTDDSFKPLSAPSALEAPARIGAARAMRPFPAGGLSKDLPADRSAVPSASASKSGSEKELSVEPDAPTEPAIQPESMSYSPTETETAEVKIPDKSASETNSRTEMIAGTPELPPVPAGTEFDEAITGLLRPSLFNGEIPFSLWEQLRDFDPRDIFLPEIVPEALWNNTS